MRPPRIFTDLLAVHRYRIFIHSLFWVLYTGFWYGLYLLNSGNSPAWEDLLVNVLYLAVHAGATYINLYLLIPRFLSNKRYGIYLLALFMDIILGGTCLFLFYYRAEGTGSIWAYLIEDGVIAGTYAATATSVFITMIIKLVKESRASQIRNRQLEQEKMKAELKLLKAQLNPHFLFNAINGIYFLIHKNPDLAAASLIKFSEMLRYQLYECNDKEIPLQQEIHYLQNYVELARLRKGDRITVHFEVAPGLNGAKVAPFLMLPLVENAFKHASDEKDLDNWIHISLKQKEPQSLELLVANSISPKQVAGQEVLKSGGIGLENVRQRLSILYPGKEALTLRQTATSFKAQLMLPLS